MYTDISQPAPPLPKSGLKEIRSNINILAPLSRRGHGPGLLILVPDHNYQLDITEGVPSPILKWARGGLRGGGDPSIRSSSWTRRHCSGPRCTEEM